MWGDFTELRWNYGGITVELRWNYGIRCTQPTWTNPESSSGGLGRARDGADRDDRSHSARQIDGTPTASSRAFKRKLEDLAAILGCTDRQSVPAATAKRMDSEGRARMQQQFLELRRLVELG